MSFAGAQRMYVERVAGVLLAGGVRCFYDADQVTSLWGRHLSEELTRVYGQESAAVVVFVSAEYAAGPWTVLERRAALSRAARERREYVLPARFDDTPLPGILPDVVFLDLRDLAPEEFAEVIRAKLADLDLWEPRSGQPIWVSAEVPGTPMIPGRLPTFTGRRPTLAAIRRHLNKAGAVAVISLYGMGGVGKTQLAIEFAWHHQADYDVVWWIDAEQPALIGPQIAALAGPLGLPPASAADAATRVLQALRQRAAWLLIFDNAREPDDVQQWLPGGRGHVLITSRNPAWGALSHRIELDVMTPAEATTLLKRRVADITPAVAAELARELGFLPLALEQAAAYLERTSLPPATYLRRFRRQRERLLAAGHDLAYRGTIASAWSLALEQLNHRTPECTTLLELCASCAPEPIPLSLFHARPDLLPAPLAEALGSDDPEASLDELVAGILSYSLARRHDDTIQLHRLVQAVIINRLPAREQEASAGTLAELLTYAAGNLTSEPEIWPGGPESWPGWAALGPHILHAASRASRADPHNLRPLANRFCVELAVSGGHYAAARKLAAQLYSASTEKLGHDHADTLRSADNLALAYILLRDHRAAKTIAADTHERRLKLQGRDHPDTLESANSIFCCLGGLGELDAARQLAEDTYSRRRRVLGENDVITLASAHNLAESLMRSGELAAALAMHENILATRRQLLGDDHSATMLSVSSIAEILCKMGNYRSALTTAEENLTRRRRVQGDDHPETLMMMTLLATALDHLGQHQQALREARTALDRQRLTLPPDHPDIQETEALCQEIAIHYSNKT